MLNAYHPEAWHELFVVLGGAIAALTGLLFVATSLHVERIREAAHWRRRAFTNTFALVGALIESMLVLFPQPASWLADPNLIALNAALFVSDAAAHSQLAEGSFRTAALAVVCRHRGMGARRGRRDFLFRREAACFSSRQAASC